MKPLTPSPRTQTADFDPLAEFPADIDRLVTAARNAGYRLMPHDAAELWRRHAGELCASWFEVTGDDHAIVAALLKHADIQPDATDLPTPPAGYPSWLDFAVDTMDTRTEEQDRLFGGESVSRQSMRDAAWAELTALRKKAGEV